MFENTGLDRSFLADIHNISASLKRIEETLRITLTVIANNISIQHPEVSVGIQEAKHDN